MMSINLSDITIVIIHGAGYPGIISGISKSETVNFLQKAELKEKMRTL